MDVLQSELLAVLLYMVASKFVGTVTISPVLWHKELGCSWQKFNLAVMNLTLILKKLILNSGQDSVYHDWSYSWFSLVLEEILEYYLEMHCRYIFMFSIAPYMINLTFQSVLHNVINGLKVYSFTRMYLLCGQILQYSNVFFRIYCWVCRVWDRKAPIWKRIVMSSSLCFTICQVMTSSLMGTHLWKLQWLAVSGSYFGCYLSDHSNGKMKSWWWDTE